MCFKYVWLAGAILIFGFILPACMVNVQIDGVINVGKKFSYHYEVIIPEQKDIPTTNTTQLQSSIQQQEQIQEQPKKQVQSQIYKLTEKHEQPAESVAEPEQAELNEQLRIIENSRKHATSGSYFNTGTKHLFNKYLQTKQHNEKQEQLRFEAQPVMQEQIHNNSNFRKYETLSPYFTPTNEPLLDHHSRVEIQPRAKLSAPEDAQSQFREHLMQDRFQHDTILRIQDRLNAYINPVNDRILEQQAEINKQLEEDKKSRLQEQSQSRERFQMVKETQLQNSENSNLINERLLSQQQQIKEQAEEQQKVQEYKQTQLQEQQQMQERFSIDKKVEMQDMPNLYYNPVNGHIIDQQQQMKKQSKEQEQSQENQQMQERLLSQQQQIKKQAEEQQKAQEFKQTQLQEQQQMQERFSIDKNEGMQDMPTLYYNPVNGHIIAQQQQMKKQFKEQERSQENQQMQEQFQNDKSLRMPDTLKPEYKNFDRQMKKESDEHEQSLEHKYLRLQNQPQMQERFQINEPLLKQKTLNSYINAENEQLGREIQKQSEEQEESQEGKSPRLQEQQQIQEIFPPQIKERLEIETNLRTKDISNANFNPVNESLLAQELQIKKQSDEHEQASIHSQPHIQEVYEIDKSLRTLNVSNTYFSLPNAQPLSQQQHMNTQSEEQEKSKESKLPQLKEQAHMLESSQMEANGDQLVRRPHMKTQTEEEQSQEYEQSELQEQPLMQFFGIDVNLQTRDKNKYSISGNEHLTVEQSQTQEQSEERNHSEEYEQSRGQEQSRTPEQPQMQEVVHIDDQSRIVETPNLHSQSLNKGLLDDQTPLQKLSVKHDQSRIQEMLQFEENLRTQKTSISYFDLQNKHLPEELPQQKERIPFNQQSNGYQQKSRPKGESRELGQIHLQQESKFNEPPQRPELSRIQKRPRAYEQSRMQEKSIVYRQSAQQTTRNPYIISVNKRLEEERPQINKPNEPIIHKQTQEQLPVMLAESQGLPGFQINKHLQTEETLKPYSYSENKLPLMEDQPLIKLQSQEFRQSNVGQYSEVPLQLRIKGLSKEEYPLQIQQLPQIRNQSRMQDLTIFQQSRIQGQSQTYSEKTKSPHFYSINKRIIDEQSQGKESSHVHFVNKHLSNGQSQVQEQSRNSQKQRVHETANPYFKSINKRLEDMQSGTQDPSHLRKTSKRHFHSVNKRLTTEFMAEDIKKSSRKEVTIINPYINSVNKRFTDGEYQAQGQLLQPEHNNKNVEGTTNRYFHSVNKRLTTGETDDRFHEKDRSDYDEIAAEWFETPATTKHKKIHHHNDNSRLEISAYHQHHQHHQHHGPLDQTKVESTVFEDLTIRKRKRQKTTTISHGHGHRHHRNKTLFNMYPNLHGEHTKLDTMLTKITFKGSNLLRNKNILTTSSSVQQHQQLNITKRISIGFQDLFTIKDYDLNLLRQEKNSSKQNRVQNKYAQPTNNKTSELGNSKGLLFKQMVTQMITNLTYHDIFGHPLKIKNDTQIKTFTMHILQSGLSVFAVLKEKATDWAIKRKFDELAEKYEKKYKEFLTDTCRHEIKTSLGKQKVLLNAIDVSDRILKRLFNFIVADMDQKGSLRDNIATAINFQQEVDKETNLEFNHVCKKFGICKTGNGFPKFLVEYLTVILKCDDTKFKLAMDSLTEITKNIDFGNIFQKRTRHIIRSTVNRLELLDVKTLRPAFMIVKNIAANKNRPLAVSKSESHSGKINSTLALLAIIDILEEKLPRTDANIIEWGDLQSGLDDWLQDRRSDVVDIMGRFVKHIMSAFDNMPADLKEHIAQNFERVVNVY